MTAHSDATEQIVRFALDGMEHTVKLTGSGALQLGTFLVALAKQTNKETGKVRLASMYRSKRPVHHLQLKDSDVARFVEGLKAYKFPYSVAKSTLENGKTDFFFYKDNLGLCQHLLKSLDINDKFSSVEISGEFSEKIKENDSKDTINPIQAREQNQSENFYENKERFSDTSKPKKEASVRGKLNEIKKSNNSQQNVSKEPKQKKKVTAKSTPKR